MGQRKDLQLQVLQSKCSKKGGAKAWSQEEAYLRFSQAEGNMEAILSNT